MSRLQTSATLKSCQSRVSTGVDLHRHCHLCSRHNLLCWYTMLTLYCSQALSWPKVPIGWIVTLVLSCEQDFRGVLFTAFHMLSTDVCMYLFHKPRIWLSHSQALWRLGVNCTWCTLGRMRKPRLRGSGLWDHRKGILTCRWFFPTEHYKLILLGGCWNISLANVEKQHNLLGYCTPLCLNCNVRSRYSANCAQMCGYNRADSTSCNNITIWSAKFQHVVSI